MTVDGDEETMVSLLLLEGRKRGHNLKFVLVGRDVDSKMLLQEFGVSRNFKSELLFMRDWDTVKCANENAWHQSIGDSYMPG